MPKYAVEVKTEIYFDYEVEAGDEEEAQDLAMERLDDEYFASPVDWAEVSSITNLDNS